ncbi:hypothetical protein [Oryzifoliimicrobium ureilyticus]|uniref:hypothetical protein n=1 Tax=Oryzifoliimicrobium ureilyticus TaxID=3113724 RepID=UPI0030767332
MESSEAIERWALCRAQEILHKEGYLLMDAAQALDKKRTQSNAYLLRNAIVRSLMEAASGPKLEISSESH